MRLLRAAGAVYKPVDELDLGPDSKELYVEANIKAPIMGGFLAKIFAWTLEAGIFGTLVLYIMKRINRVHEVAERFIDAVRESSRRPLPVSFFINYDAEDILRQATESTLRYERGAPISVLDGVPMAVKDEMNCSPYPTTGGTKWLHKVRPCTGDACCVARLRSYGAIIVGKRNMHELGVTPSGTNPHYGAPRYPYDPSRISGGSSSGSAALVSAGLCPASLGVDGGTKDCPSAL